MESSYGTTTFYERIWGFDIGFYRTSNMDGGDVDSGVYIGRISAHPTSRSQAGNGFCSIGMETYEGSVNDIGLQGSAYSDKYNKSASELIFVDPAKIIDKTVAEISEYALSIGLTQTAANESRKVWVYSDPNIDSRTDPVSAQRIRIDAYADHVHAFDPSGVGIDARGNERINYRDERLHLPIVGSSGQAMTM